MHRVPSFVTRKGQLRPFITSLVVALLVMPVAEALAFYAATGSGTTTAPAATNTSTVTLARSGAETFAGPSTTALAPGGTVSFTVTATCTSGCPAEVTIVQLSPTWSNSQSAPCDPTDMPNSFSMPNITYNNTIGTTATSVGTAVITWNNLSTDQSSCAGGTFTFTFVTP
jgi:hypothetical protein